MDPKIEIAAEIATGRVPKLQTDLRERTNRLRKNSVVTQSIARLDSEVLPGAKRSRAGRKMKYTPTKFKNLINKYFEWCEQEDRVPSITGLMINLNMYRDQFYRYVKYPDYSDIIEHTRMIISEWCANDVYRTKGQAAGKIAYMKNIHGWSEKTENHTTVQKIVTPDEARAKIEMLAPKLLEVLKNNTVLSQIIAKEEAQKPAETIIEANPIPALGFVEENNPRRL